MATGDQNKELRPSILDRLLDDDPHVSIEADKSKFGKLKDLRASVRRDLEALLNTRFRVVSPPLECKELHSSLLNYGLPDLATVNMLDIAKKQEFTRNLESIIRSYEPRFKSVRVQHMDNKDKHDRTVRFRIDAIMYADPAPEVVVFDSVLEPILRTVTVEDSHG